MGFCMQMVNHLMLEEIKKPNPKNAVLSPLSINTVLNMIAMGTTGATLERLQNRLGFKSVEEIKKKSCETMEIANNDGKVGPIVTSINGVWVDQSYTLKDSYVELLKSIYRCKANHKCDFANNGHETLVEINKWAESASKGLIKNVLNKIDPDTALILANALYFKGTWSNKFDREKTKAMEFDLLDGHTVRVPFMTSSKSFDYGEFDGYKVLRAPYKSGSNTSFSMYFFLPNEKNGLPNLLETFNSDSQHMFLKPDLYSTSLQKLWIPRFKFSYDFNPDEYMKMMGLEIPYNGNPHDFGEMIEVPKELPPLSTKIIQKAFIEVDEYGTEASAVSVATFRRTCCIIQKDPLPEFVADHPFMFVIKEDKSGHVFFTGIVLNPKL